MKASSTSGAQTSPSLPTTRLLGDRLGDLAGDRSEGPVLRLFTSVLTQSAFGVAKSASKGDMLPWSYIERSSNSLMGGREIQLDEGECDGTEDEGELRRD